MSNLISLTNGLGSALGVGHLGQSIEGEKGKFK